MHFCLYLAILWAVLIRVYTCLIPSPLSRLSRQCPGCVPPFIDPSPGCQGLGALAARHQTLAQARKIFALQTSPAPASQACGHLMQIEHSNWSKVARLSHNVHFLSCNQCADLCVVCLCWREGALCCAVTVIVSNTIYRAKVKACCH